MKDEQPEVEEFDIFVRLQEVAEALQATQLAIKGGKQLATLAIEGDASKEVASKIVVELLDMFEFQTAATAKILASLYEDVSKLLANDIQPPTRQVS